MMSAHVAPAIRTLPDGMTIRPLTFIDTVQNMDVLVDGMLGRDASFAILERNRVARVLSRWTVLPVYFHLACTGYGVFDGKALGGMLFLRGWRGALHIEGIVVHEKYRRRGLGRAMLRLAEQQARAVNRHWLSLRVTVSNEAAIRLYESEGFRRVQHRVMVLDSSALMERASERIHLRPIARQHARAAHATYTRKDLTDGDGWAADMFEALMTTMPAARRGRRSHWICQVDGGDAGYISLQGPASAPSIYLACEARWWGTAEEQAMLAAVLGRQAQQVEIRVPSNEHHAASAQAMAHLQVREEAVAKMMMLKAIG